MTMEKSGGYALINDNQETEQQSSNHKLSVNGKKIRKIFITLGIIVMIITSLFFSFTTMVPDVIGVDEETAKTIIEKAGLIPAFKYNYVDNKDKNSSELLSDYMEKGKVYEINPSHLVKSGGKVNISVSKGPKFIKPKEGIIKCTPFNELDDLQFMSNIDSDNLQITLIPVIKNCTNFKWNTFCFVSTDAQDFSLLDNCTDASFDNKIPVNLEVRDSKKFLSDSGEIVVGEDHYIYITVPLNSLEKRTLEKLYMELSAEKDGTKQTFELLFQFSW